MLPLIRPVLDPHKQCGIKDPNQAMICGQRALFVVNKRAMCRDHYENWKDRFVTLPLTRGEVRRS